MCGGTKLSIWLYGINWFDLSNDRNYKLYLEKLESFKKDCPEQITNILQDSVNIWW